MDKTKWGKNILFKTTLSPYHKHQEDVMMSLHRTTSENIDGDFYLNTTWHWGPDKSEDLLYKPHRHAFEELLGLYGSDANDPYNLHGEVWFWIEDEKFVITQSCVIFIPKNIWHTPYWFKRVDKPIFFIAMGPKFYSLEQNDDPKWSRFRSFPKTTEVK